MEEHIEKKVREIIRSNMTTSVGVWTDMLPRLVNDLVEYIQEEKVLSLLQEPPKFTLPKELIKSLMEEEKNGEIK